MLAAPLKSSKELSWERPLQDFIRSQYGGDSVVQEYWPDLQRLNNARKRAVQVTVPDEASIESVKKYLSLLQTVSVRFPSIKGGDGKSEWRHLSFTWSDAFRPKSTISQTDLTFEQACLIFNLGALESLAGIKQDMKTPESLKIACQCFSRAAGYFACLERGMAQDENAGSTRLPGTLTSDISPEGLGMLKNLMLAQAQYCCLETALLNELKSGALAKVAAQVTKFYDLSMNFAKNPNLAKILDPAWANHIEFHKRKNESMCANYYAQSIAEKAKKSGSGYGDQVAWLTKAENLSRSAWEWANKKGLPGGLIVPLRTLLDKVQADLATAISDNNQIYFQQVPDPSSLPAVEGHVMAKAAPVEERLFKMKPSDDPIFKNLLIPWMRLAEESFQNKLAGLVKAYGDKVTTRTNEVRQGLADAGLPAAVEAGAEGENGLPSALWQRISEQVIAKGGIAGLQADAHENKRSNDFLSQRVRELELDLNTEKDADESTRAQHGSAFAAQPSRQLNQNMYNDLAQFRNLLGQAKLMDDKVAEDVRANAVYLDLLSKSREELTSFLPDVKDSIQNDPNVEKVRKELMVLLVYLGLKVQECEAAQTQFVEATSGASIVSDLEKTDKTKLNDTIQGALNNFQPFMQEVDSKLSSISAKFNAVLEKNHSFAALRTQNDATRKREKALAALNTAVQKFQELYSQVKEGARFYEDMAAQVEQCRVVIQDYCFVRNVERDEFIQSRAGRQHPSPSFADAPVAPILTPPPAPTRPQLQSAVSFSHMTAPHRHAPPPPIAQSAASAGLSPAYRQTVQQMKDALGLYQTPDDVLAPYVTAANGDLNIAMDKYVSEKYFANCTHVAKTNFVDVS